MDDDEPDRMMMTVSDDIAYNGYTDSKFNYSYSIRIRPNNSVNYSHSAE